MAVVNIKKMWSRVRMSKQGGVYTVSVLYSALMGAADDAPELALQHADMPQEGDEYPGATLGFMPRCYKTEVVDRPGPLLYVVEASYSSAGSSVAVPENPLMEPPRISWRTVTITEEADISIRGKPLLNTAGVPFRGLNRDRSDSLLVITANVESFSNAFARQYRNKINSDVFLGCAVGTLKCNRIDANTAEKNGYSYYAVELEFQETEYPENFPTQDDIYAWDWHLISMGVHEKKVIPPVAAPQLVPIQIRGQDATEPQVLDQDGKWLKDPAGNPGNIGKCQFQRYKRADFSPLLS